MKKVIVKSSVVDKLKRLNPWIYKNEIKKLPKNLKIGDLVNIYSPRGEFLATGYINPKSVIAIRVLSFNEEKIDIYFFRSRIKRAIEKRKNLKSITNSYRLIHSEADFLPGLIVDYYDNYLSVQINTAGIERFRNEIISVLIDEIKPKGIYEKSDRKAREKEGLETEEKLLYGTISDKLLLEENKIKFILDLKNSQKTGFYLDQRKNREVVSRYSKGKVLDIFSNSGGFGIYSFYNGAEYIKFVDISSNAIHQLEENCLLNNIKNYSIVKEDAFDFLKNELNKGERYDLIVLDPPPFAKTKRERDGALRGFKYLISHSLKLLNNEGYLAVFSCSYSITMEDLKALSLELSSKEKVYLEVVEHLYQDTRDHPYMLNIPNSLYLKGILLRKIV